MVTKKVTKKAVKHTPYVVGKNMFFRTVTMSLIGVVKSVGPQEIVLKGSTVMWIADTGRFTQAFQSTSLMNETEIYGCNDVTIGRGAIVDATIYSGACEVKQK